MSLVGKVVNTVLAKLPVGPKHLQMLQSWMPSVGVFGTGAAALGLYFADLKIVNQFIPFYGGKYKEEEEE